MISPGQSDRMSRLIEMHRDAGMSLYDAMQAAAQDVEQEHEQAVSWKSHAHRVSGRVMNDTQMGLMCKGDLSRIASDMNKERIERRHRAKA
jgi:hypothetical protein